MSFDPRSTGVFVVGWPSDAGNVDTNSLNDRVLLSNNYGGYSYDFGPMAGGSFTGGNWGGVGSYLPLNPDGTEKDKAVAINTPVKGPGSYSSSDSVFIGYNPLVSMGLTATATGITYNTFYAGTFNYSLATYTVTNVSGTVHDTQISDGDITLVLSGAYNSTAWTSIRGHNITLNGGGSLTTANLAVSGNLTVNNVTVSTSILYVDQAMQGPAILPSDAGTPTPGNPIPNTTFTVTGSKGVLNVTDTLDIGMTSNGLATLQITNGAQLNSDGGASIGLNSGSAGALVIDNATANFTGGPNDSQLQIGARGMGSMTVSNNATVNMTSTAGVFVGTFAGGSGILTVQSGSKMTIAGELAVGGSGTGEGGSAGPNQVFITGGAKVISGTDPTAFAGVIAAQFNQAATGSQGSVTIDGSGSLWDLKGNLSIGAGGNATLTVQNGGTLQVEGNIIDIGHYSGASGRLVLDGSSGSAPTFTFTTSGAQMIIGDGGDGTVQVRGGANLDLSNITITLGNVSGGNGTFLVGDPGTSASASTVKFTNLVIGAGGTGEMDIAGQSTADLTGLKGSLILGRDAGSSGTLEIDGPNAKLNFAGQIVIGQSGSGTLKIEDGASFTPNTANYANNGGALSFVLGANAGTGNLVVDGNGSQFTVNQGSTQVGGAGSGTITVSNGATLTTADITIGGGSANATGNVTLTGQAGGSATVWNASGNVTVGSIGAGTLNVGANSKLTLLQTKAAPRVGIMVNEGNNTLQVSGQGASVQIPDYLYVNGDLDLDFGGQIQVGLSGNSGSPSSGALVIRGTATIADQAQLAYGAPSNFGGTTTISSGGKLTGNYTPDSQTNLGDNVFGTVTITGSDSTWKTPLLSLGNYTPPGSSTPVGGQITISSGGTLTTATATIGTTSGASGILSTVTMNDVASFWNGQNLTVATGGTINVNGGALYATNELDIVGGQINLNGAAAAAQLRAKAVVFFGDGQLSISNGGDATVTGSLLSLAAGTLSVSSGGRLDVSTGHNIYVGGGSLNLDGNASQIYGLGNLYFGADPNAVPGFALPGSSLAITGGATLTADTLVKTVAFGPAAAGIHLVGTSTATTIDVSNGTLIVGTRSSLVKPNSVNVGAGGTLSGAFKIIGSLIVNGLGTLKPNDAATITISGDYEQQAGGVLDMAIGGPKPGDSDHLVVGGKATLGGYLELDFINGFAPTAGETFSLLSYGSMTGQFSNVIVTGLAPGWTFSLAPGGGALTLGSKSNAIASPEFVVPLGPNIVLTGGGQITPGENIHFVGGILEAVTNNTISNPIILDLNGGAFQADPGTSTTLSGPISGPGAFLKTGRGILTLTGAGTYTGNTDIAEGALFVDGTLASPKVIVESAGFLGGTGTLFGNVFNYGVVSPGDAPGTLHFQGTYTQGPGGLLLIRIGGAAPSEHDLLAVSGVANLGGTLQLVRLDNYKLRLHEPITFLTATGGIVGKFAAIEDSFTTGNILVPTVVYHSNSVDLEAVQGSFAQFADRAKLPPNERNIAGALDSAAGDSRAASLFNFLDYQSLSKLPKDLEKISPEGLTSIFTISTSYAQQQSLNLQRRTDDIRSGSNGFSAANLAINGDNPFYSGGFDLAAGVAGPSGDDGQEMKETKEVVPAESRWGVFLSGTGEWVNVSGTQNARGYEIASGGFTLGLDYKVTPNLAIGLAAGYTGATADLNGGGRVYMNSGKFGLYATFFDYQRVKVTPTMSKDGSKEAPAPSTDVVPQGLYADVAVFGGYNSYDTHRSALQGEARGDTDGGELNVLFGTGYDFRKGNLTFGPTASFNYTYAGMNGFTEHDSLAPLDIHGGHADSLRTAFGLKASYDWKVGGVLIKPEFRAAWQHEFGDTAYALNSSFANGAGGAFVVNGPKFGRDSALLSAGFAVQFNDRCSAYLYYDGNIGRTNYESESVTGGFRITF